MSARGFKVIARITMVLGAAVALLLALPAITDWAADGSFGNAVPASDDEAAVTVSVPRWSSAEWGAIAGRGEGLDCSIPGPVLAAFATRVETVTENGRRRRVDQAPVNLRFRQACVAHDLCYRHGRATYGYTQAQCDAALVEASFRICKHMYARQVAVDWCATQARKVLAGVTLGGTTSFRPSVEDQRDLGLAASSAARVSTRAEYDPYPSPVADLVAPRLLLAWCGGARRPALFLFEHRPGGSAAETLCFDGSAFASPTATKQRAPHKGEAARPPPGVGSEYAFRISPPVLVGGWDSGRLVEWCRDWKENRSTRGLFVDIADPLRFGGCAHAPGDPEDRLVETPVPFGGPLSASIPAVGLTEEVLTYYRPAVLRSPRRDLVGCRDNAGLPTRCSAPLPGVCPDRGRDLDRYRWFAIAPSVMPMTVADASGGHPAAVVTVFARGCGTERDYQTLQSRSVLLEETGWRPRADGHQAEWSQPLRWKLPETGEPFVMLDAGAGRTALLSIHAAPAGHDLRRIVALLFAIIAVALAIAAVVAALRMDVAGAERALLLTCLAIATYCGHRAAAPPPGDPSFGPDAIVRVLKPDAAKPAPSVRLRDGRAWLQQRIPVVRSGSRYFAILQRLLPPDQCGQRSGLCLDLKVATVESTGSARVGSAGLVHLPWADRSTLSRFALIPFRGDGGALLLLATDFRMHWTVLGQRRKEGNRFAPLAVRQPTSPSPGRRLRTDRGART